MATGASPRSSATSTQLPRQRDQLQALAVVIPSLGVLPSQVGPDARGVCGAHGA